VGAAALLGLARWLERRMGDPYVGSDGKCASVGATDAGAYDSPEFGKCSGDTILGAGAGPAAAEVDRSDKPDGPSPATRRGIRQ
jgi:hypothetical protein